METAGSSSSRGRQSSIQSGPGILLTNSLVLSYLHPKSAGFFRPPSCAAMAMEMAERPSPKPFSHSDPAAKQLILAIDERLHFVIQDLDDTHLLISTESVEEMREQLELEVSLFSGRTERSGAEKEERARGAVEGGRTGGRAMDLRKNRLNRTETAQCRVWKEDSLLRLSQTRSEVMRQRARNQSGCRPKLFFCVMVSECQTLKLESLQIPLSWKRTAGP